MYLFWFNFKSFDPFKINILNYLRMTFLNEAKKGEKTEEKNIFK